METIFMKNENSKMNQLHKFVLNLSQRLDLRSLKNNDTLQNLSTYYTWKNISIRRINLKNLFLFCFQFSRLYQIYH